MTNEFDGIPNVILEYYALRAGSDKVELDEQVVEWLGELEFLRSNVTKMDDIVMSIIDWAMECKAYASVTREICHRLVRENEALKEKLGGTRDAEAKLD